MHAGQHPVHLFFVADVHLNGEHRRAALRHLRRDGLHRRDVRNREAGARLRERTRVVPPYPHRAAGDDDHLVLYGHASSFARQARGSSG